MASLGTLRQLALKLTRSQFDADDLLQATCLRALESASRLRDHSNLAGWLARVMRNLQIDQSRSRSRRTVPLTDRHVAACAPEGIAVWRQVDDEEVERLLPRLSPQLRAVWELHHVGGLDQNAIAERLGILRTTVATRMFRARLTLRTALLQRYGEADEVADGPDAVGGASGPRGKVARKRLRGPKRPVRPRLRVHAGGKSAPPAAAASTGVDREPAPALPGADAIAPPPPAAASAL